MSCTPSQHVHSLGRLYLKNEQSFVQVSMEGSKATLIMRFVSRSVSIHCKLPLCSAKGEDGFGMSSAGVLCSSFRPIDLTNKRCQSVNDNSPTVFYQRSCHVVQQLGVDELGAHPVSA